MATATLEIQMDANLKQEAESALRDMGLTMPAAITLFCRQVLNQGRIPFDIVLPEVPNEETRHAMEETLAGRNLSRTFDSVDEMWQELNA